MIPHKFPGEDRDDKGYKVQYNGFTEYFPSKAAAQRFARDVKAAGGGHIKPTVKPC